MRLTEDEISFLWCMPPQCDLFNAIHWYTFIQRTATPQFEFLTECLRKAVRVGIVEAVEPDQFSICPRWHERLHQHDPKDAAGELGMIQISEELSAMELDEDPTREFKLDLAIYEQAAARMEEENRRLFGEG